MKEIPLHDDYPPKVNALMYSRRVNFVKKQSQLNVSTAISFINILLLA